MSAVQWLPAAIWHACGNVESWLADTPERAVRRAIDAAQDVDLLNDTVEVYGVRQSAEAWEHVATEHVRLSFDVDHAETLTPCPICGTGWRPRDVPERMREALNDAAGDHA